MSKQKKGRMSQSRCLYIMMNTLVCDLDISCDRALAAAFNVESIKLRGCRAIKGFEREVLYLVFENEE